MHKELKKYQYPTIENIRLDNEISLTLDSLGAPWVDPELFSNTNLSDGGLMVNDVL
jgi:hypothetical protein